MALLNPANAVPVTLTFTVAGTGTTTDDLGNPIPNETTAPTQVIMTPLGASSLQQVQQSLGTERQGRPVKLRCQSSTGKWPAAVPRGVLVEAKTTYAGRPATVALVLDEPNPHVVGLGLLPGLGQSAMGLLSVG